MRFRVEGAERYARAAQHYAIEFALDKACWKVTAITWSKNPKPGSAATHPGVYCLRTTLTEPDGAALWRIYSMLTTLELVFRSLKTDLGLRPVYHHMQRRVEGHLFISVLAYYAAHTLRQRLKAEGIGYFLADAAQDPLEPGANYRHPATPRRTHRARPQSQPPRTGAAAYPRGAEAPGQSRRHSADARLSARSRPRESAQDVVPNAPGPEA